MAIKKKSLIGAATDKKAADDGSGKSAANPAPPAKGKKLAVAKVATAKLSTARLMTLRKLN
jgi:hypothetical protein